MDKKFVLNVDAYGAMLLSFFIEKKDTCMNVVAFHVKNIRIISVKIQNTRKLDESTESRLEKKVCATFRECNQKCRRNMS